MRMPCATVADLEDELVWIEEALAPPRNPVDTPEARANRRARVAWLLEHKADVEAQLAELGQQELVAA